jgi:hypothetical protein
MLQPVVLVQFIYLKCKRFLQYRLSPFGVFLLFAILIKPRRRSAFVSLCLAMKSTQKPDVEPFLLFNHLERLLRLRPPFSLNTFAAVSLPHFLAVFLLKPFPSYSRATLRASASNPMCFVRFIHSPKRSS